MKVTTSLFGRSVWKGPHIVPLPIVRPKAGESVKPIKTQARSAVILPNFVGLIFQVHNGKIYNDVVITEDMVGKKLGEFSAAKSKVPKEAGTEMTYSRSQLIIALFNALTLTVNHAATISNSCYTLSLVNVEDSSLPGPSVSSSVALIALPYLSSAMPEHQARRIYSAEELHRLRGSCSAPKLSEAIEEHVAEDAELVKEHILRGSRSFAARSFRSRHGLNSLRASSDHTNNENASVATNEQIQPPPAVADRSALAEIAPNNQYYRAPTARFRVSPTPSVKRKKVEDLVRAHGSPQHMRVTAGGRIVPKDQSPLCFPRFGYSAIKANGGLVKFAPGHQPGKTPQWTHPLQDGTQQGYLAQDPEGRLHQIVDDIILPLSYVDGAYHLYIPAPNLSIEPSAFGAGPALSESTMQEHQRITDSVPPLFVQPANAAAQMVTLDAEYTRLEASLKELDKTEAIHGRQMSRATKDDLVHRRRQLVIGMDRVRKTIKSLKQRAQDERPQTPRPGPRSEHASVSPASTIQHARQPNASYLPPPGPYYSVPHYMPPSAGLYEHEYMPGPYMMAPMSYWMPPAPFDGMPQHLPPYQPYPSMPAQVTEALPTAQRDGASDQPKMATRPSSPRYSHALLLKDPETKQVYNVKSLLNPMSPVYKPAVDGHNGSERSSLVNKAIKERVPTPMSFARATGETKHTEEDHTGNVSTDSSIRTLDFFPQNARDHSMRKHEYPVSTKGSSKENTGPRNSDRASSEMSSARVDHHDTDWNPEIPPRTFTKTVASPKAPPGTPVKVDVTKTQQHETATGSIFDFRSKPRAWIEGYQAGLQRRAVTEDRSGAFLDGYCSGWLKSDSDESLSRPVDNDQMMRRNAVSSAPDALKQAVFAPANETAILSPAPDDPTIAKTECNLGAWQKEHDLLMSAGGQGLGGYPLPDRKSSLTQPQTTVQARRDSMVKEITIDTTIANDHFRRDFSFTSEFSQGDDSSAGIARTVHNKRVATPLEWRTRNSLANVANMTTSMFAHSQVDGHPADKRSPYDDCQPMLSNAADMAGSALSTGTGSHFREASLDGLSPPMSPVLSMHASPPVSPRTTAMKRFRERHASPKMSPTQQSPVKAQTATKAPKTSPQKYGNGSDSSPTKRGWKDLLRGRTISGKPGTP